MSLELIKQIMDILIGLILVTPFLVIGSRRLVFCVKIIALQAVLLTAVSMLMAFYTQEAEIYMVAGLTFIIKVLFIPYLLYWVIKKIKVKKDTMDFIGTKTSLILAGMLVILSFTITPQALSKGDIMFGNSIPVAISLLFLGLFEIITRKQALMQVIGILMMENGLYLVGVGTTYGMPLVVELGIFLDIFVGALIMGVLTFQINRTFDSIDTNQLKNLKG
ncbi:MAG: hydrogenase [Peptococcaceae bacterium]|nr:hydrogenase [Peptococcaceae bacterium]